MECEHKIKEYSEDFISGLWILRCAKCGLSTSEHLTQEEALVEFEAKLKELK